MIIAITTNVAKVKPLVVAIWVLVHSWLLEGRGVVGGVVFSMLWMKRRLRNKMGNGVGKKSEKGRRQLG